MERWRTFFGKANADIFTVIEQAINVAAMDHPEVFKVKRADIAETLFARNLVHTIPTHDELASLGDAVDDEQPTSAMEEGELKDDSEERGLVDDGEQRLLACYDEAEVRRDDEGQEAVLIERINGIKEAIKDDGQPESILLDLLQKLEDTQITVNALKVTEIGKQVNVLRKHHSKYIRAVVKRLVKHWKFLVDEWVKVAGDASDATAASPAALAGSHFREEPETVESLQTPLTSLVNDALSFPTDKSLSGELPKLFSFIGEDIYGQEKRRPENPLNSSEHSVKGSVHNSCWSQSGSALTYSSDCDARVSTSQTWGLQTPGEMGSATRDNHPSERTEKVSEPVSRGLPTKRDIDQRGANHLSDSHPLSKTLTKNLNSARTSTDMSKTRAISSTVAGRPANHLSNSNRTHLAQNSSVLHLGDSSMTVKPSILNKSADKSQVDQKLEIAKRKLHQGYQQAENAKKQRTVQVLDFPDLPKTSEMRGKVHPAAQSHTGFQSGHWGQNKR